MRILYFFFSQVIHTIFQGYDSPNFLKALFVVRLYSISKHFFGIKEGGFETVSSHVTLVGFVICDPADSKSKLDPHRTHPTRSPCITNSHKLFFLKALVSGKHTKWEQAKPRLTKCTQNKSSLHNFRRKKKKIQ